MDSDDEEEISERNLRALAAACLRDTDDGEGEDELIARDSDLDDLWNTRSLILGSQRGDSVPTLSCVSPPSPPNKRPRPDAASARQSAQCSTFSGINFQEVSCLPEVVTPLPPLKETNLPVMDVGCHTSDPHQSAESIHVGQQEGELPSTANEIVETESEKIPITTLRSLQEEASCSFEKNIMMSEAEDILEEELLFGEEYFWDYSEVDSDFPLNTQHDLWQREFIEEEDPEEVPQTSSQDRGTPLYPGSKINILESLTSLLSFIQSVHLSGVGLGQLLSLINLHLPEPNNFLKSNYAVSQMLACLDEPVHVHHFCSICYKTRQSLIDLCDSCTDESRYVHYFLTFPLVAQLSRLLKRPDFVHNLQYKLTRSKKNSDNIEDIFDGEVYKQMEAQNLNINGVSISLMFNTDGVQMFTSNTYSLWPVYLVVNELPPEKRFLSENLLIAGLWGSVIKPHPNVFLLPIYKDLVPLKNGVEMNVFGATEPLKVCAKIVCATCDAPATAMFMNIKSHSGFYSCPVCTIKGIKPGDSTVFPYEENVPLRDMVSYQNQVNLAVQNKVILSSTVRNEERFCGVKGPTILCHILDNMLSSMAIDSLHCIFLGCTKQMLRLWFDKDFKNNPLDFSAHDKVATLTSRLLNMAPPHFLQRLHQPVEKLVHWKATEFRSFLFYLSAILLQDILKPDIYNHFTLFVKGVSLLNSSSISYSDIEVAGKLLNQFVQEFEVLYGVDNVSHNVHMCTHLHHVVKLLGPLWATSCFQFEDMNGRLKNLTHGTRHIGLQVHSQLAMITHLPLMVRNLTEGPAKSYCENLRKKYRLKTFDVIAPSVYCVGSLSAVNLDNAWIFGVLREKGVLPPNYSTNIYDRLLKNRLLYVSSNYKRGERNSSHCKYKTDDQHKYGNIKYFVKVSCTCNEKGCSCVPAKYMAIIKPVPVVQFQTETMTFSHIFKVDATHVQNEFFNIDVVDIFDLETVMYKIDYLGTMYLSEPLNNFELE